MTLYTSKVVAEWLGLTERRVRQLRDEGIISEARPGLYDLRQTVTRYLTYLRRGSGDLNEERTMLTRAKREAVERENKLREGSLHSAEDIEKGMKTMCLNVRGRLLSLPAKLAPALVGMEGDREQIFDLLTEAIREALEELKDYSTLMAEIEEREDEEEGRDDETE